MAGTCGDGSKHSVQQYGMLSAELCPRLWNNAVGGISRVQTVPTGVLTRHYITHTCHYLLLGVGYLSS